MESIQELLKSPSLVQKQLKDLFSLQRSYLNAFFDQIDLASVEKLVNRLAHVTGIIFFTGVGKSGYIAQKLAATFVSMGIKAMFLPPTNALHGDLGIVAKDDLFIFLSKSGETEEILSLIPFIRNKGAYTVSVISKKNSRLSKASDESIYLPIEKEICPFNIVPTTSTEVQLIFGDVLAVALMQKKKLTLTEFATNHPAGKIGKELSLKVEDLMLKDEKIPMAHIEQKLKDVLSEMTLKRCGCLIVVDHDKKLEGIFTDGDLRRALQNHGSKVLEYTLKEIKIGHPKTIEPQKLAWEALELMESDQKHPFMVLPVIDHHKQVKGLIKMHDIIQSGL